ncbi:hypothetical protein MPTK1_1g24920 [Marchantia polymorpha subsp. ruderalis]|uniref:Uncharacterized protein n=2 Tax=Marchantia polymorpha TaxID=3197 RepID=A0AAF6AU10_MARPO|nr:hypothetical protein MARPO_0061s0033 [Marchantia polymorpha]BBM99930.1 hypothetical protein Mp_1g24920 [Marchantia polymorpha subsp. ruderalis]|eukprot:PTQ36756.1 hypothetical protein MARPO_0061s0033 [Marchantia polymorpha]
MSILTSYGSSSSSSACWQLNFHSVPRAVTLLSGETPRTSRVFGSSKISEARLTSTASNDVNASGHYKRLDSSVSKAFDSSPAPSKFQTGGCLGICKNSVRKVFATGNGKFYFVLNIKIKRGLVIKCSVDVPVPNFELPESDPVSKINAEQSMNPSTGSETRTDAQVRHKAAFFDVDGTITRTNVVLAYLAVRMSELSFFMKFVWVPCFAVLCIFYLLVDHFDRATFNRIFYSNHYKGRSADSKSSMAALIYERYYKPRIFAGAVEHIAVLKTLGYRIVLVTGALDFQIAPLARDIDADFVYAAELVEENGRFTGELNGMATSNSEKAERVLDYAKRFDVSLEDSMAFGDSIADISMLEMVGRPHAVNPDARLLAIALQRKWTVLVWTLQTLKATSTSTVPA